MANENQPRGRVYDTVLPTAELNGTYAPIHVDRFGNQFIRDFDRRAAAEAGAYFVAHNPTNDAATTLAGHVAPVLADADDTMTKPFLFLRVPTGSTKTIRLDYFELDCVVIGASGTEDNYAWQLDSGATRYSSGGTALTIINPNMDNANTSVLAATNHLLGGAVVSGAESANVRHGGHGQISDTIMVAGDRYQFVFGGDPALGTVDRHVINMPPIILGAEDQFLLAMYAPSQAATAAVYKCRLAWFEI